MAKIEKINSREIYNSQGFPTLETTVVLNDGTTGVASVPSGDFYNEYAAVNLVDHDQKRFHGQGVLKAVDHINNIIQLNLRGYDANKQQEIDKKLIELDGTENKSKFGANGMLSVSIAVARAAAKNSGQPLYLHIRQFIKQENSPRKVPIIILSFINGGAPAENLLDFRDFFALFATFKTFEESIQMGLEIQSSLRTIIKNNNSLPLYSIEGGYALPLVNNEEAFSLLAQALDTANIRLGYDVFFGIDANADSFYTNGKYKIKDKSRSLTTEELVSFYNNLVLKYPIIYIEDPFGADDLEGWEKIVKQVSQDTIIVGDHITSTNPYRLQTALDKKAISGITIKPIQIGTVIESLAVMQVARVTGLKIIVSHQNGSTTDDFLADFAVAVNADYINFGPLTRAESIVKYNRLLEIERQLNKI